MNDEILNEIIEGELPEQEEMVEQTTPEEEPVIERPEPRQNPFCVISIETQGEYAVRDIQTNSGWTENPYEDYAVVPDEMVPAIMETKCFCDIVLNDDGTEVVSFTAREIPEIPDVPTPEPEPTDDGSVWDEMALAIEEGVNEV